MARPARPFESILVDPVPPCAKCGQTIATVGINRQLALAIYRCPCGHQWTLDLSSGG